MINRLLWSVSVFLLLLCGCGKNTEYPHEKLNDRQVKILDDSVKLLDSLVLSTADPVVAKGYASRALQLARKAGVNRSMIQSYMAMGNACSVSQPDSAFLFYNKAFELADSLHDISIKDKIYYNLAILHLSAMDYHQSLKLLDTALLLAFKNNHAETASNCLNILGNIYSDLNDDENAHKMYDSAYKMAQRKSLFPQMGSALGNLARIEQDPDKRITMTREAIGHLKKSPGTGEAAAILLSNLASYSVNPDTAIKYYFASISMIRPEASPEIYIGNYNNMAYSYLDKKDVNKAEEYIRDYALPLALKTNSLGWQSTIYDTYSDIMKSKGQLQKALDFQKKALSLTELANKEAASSQVRLLAAILDVKNKENVIREGKIDLMRARAVKNSILLGSTIFFLLILAFFFGWMQKKRMQLQKRQIDSARRIIQAEENERTKIGRDVHDLTGQKFLSFFTFFESIQYKDISQKDIALAMLQEIKDVIRDISHKVSPKWLDKFTLEESVQGLCSDMKKVYPVNLEMIINKPFPVVSAEIKLHVFRMVQEMVTNYLKYSKDAEALIDLSVENNMLTLKYQDNGPGFDTKKILKTSTGISNIQERVSLLNGKVEIDSSPGFGTYYEINIPIS
ncbi:MAG: tetratricopeptide repeat protein [Syntrophothermus sp.]